MSALKCLTVAVTLLGFSYQADAVVFSGNAIGSWSQPNDALVLNDDANGVATIAWGLPIPSLMQFDGAGSDINNVPADWDSGSGDFLLGTLTYFNSAIWLGAISAANLSVAVTISAPPNAPGPNTFVYDIGIENTPNPEGDTLTFLNDPATWLFSYDGMEYGFDVVGFTLGQSVATSVTVNEGCTTTLNLMGRILERGPTGDPTSVPDESTTLSLFGLAALGLVFVRRQLA